MLSISAPGRRHRRALALLLAVLMGLAGPRQPATAQQAAPTYRVVAVAAGDALNIRSGPSAGYPVVGMIPPGGRGVRLVGHCRGWCPVSYNGALGWVNPAYLVPEPPAPFAERRASNGSRVPPSARGYVAAEPPAARRPAGLPSYWRVTGMAEGESLKVHDAPSATASVVHAFEPQTGCIKLAGSCRKPWCQVTFPGLNGDRVGWVDSNHLAPQRSACSN